MDIVKIAVINPEKADGLARTVIDGLCGMSADGRVDFRLSSRFRYDLPTEGKAASKGEFIDFAAKADWIFLIGNDKYGFDKDLAETIDRWDRTVYIDGSEMGKNRRYDFDVQKEIIDGTCRTGGGINEEMLEKCLGYFRREKPYVSGIRPLPFGIETRYTRNYRKETKKDIDFVCIFGQDEYPLMRRYARELVENYCAKNGFVCFTEKTKTPKEFYGLLARSKVGISVGGGGFDTLRFWEILGNNCLLLTERIDIYEPDSERLNYGRIRQFNNLFDFNYHLEKIGTFLKESYDENGLQNEYKKIVREHSSAARVEEIIKFCVQGR